MGDIQNRTPLHLPYPKLEFPTFNGEEPREWSSKSEQYFKIYQIAVVEWVEITTVHLMRKAHRWKEGYLIDKPNLSWEELVEAVNRRFDSRNMKQLIRKFNKLVQISTVEKYQEKFEDMRARMIQYNPALTERYFIESYISGLKEELIPYIDLSHPTTLEKVYEQAKLHEQTLLMM